MGDWIPWIVGAIGIIAAGGISWPTILKLLNHFKTAPLDRNPKVISRVEPLTGATVTSRAEAFNHVDALVNYFGSEGNQHGMDAAKSAGVALFRSPELPSE